MKCVFLRLYFRFRMIGIYRSKNIAKIREFDKSPQIPQVLRIIHCFLFSAHSSKTSPQIAYFLNNCLFLWAVR